MCISITRHRPVLTRTTPRRNEDTAPPSRRGPPSILVRDARIKPCPTHRRAHRLSRPLGQGGRYLGTLPRVTMYPTPGIPRRPHLLPARPPFPCPTRWPRPRRTRLPHLQPRPGLIRQARQTMQPIRQLHPPPSHPRPPRRRLRQPRLLRRRAAPGVPTPAMRPAMVRQGSRLCPMEQARPALRRGRKAGRHSPTLCGCGPC